MDKYFVPIYIPIIIWVWFKGSIICVDFYPILSRFTECIGGSCKNRRCRTLSNILEDYVPLAKPAMLVVFLFSVVWNWNDVFQPNMYLLVPDFFNLAQNLATFNGSANQEGLAQVSNQITASDALGLAPTKINQIMAAVMLTILPIMILYLFVQRSFVESIERSGITGE